MIDLLAERERNAVAIVDRAATGRNGDPFGALRQGGRRMAVAFDQLYVDQAGKEHQQRGSERPLHRPQPYRELRHR